jgi:hypothetical protein
MGTAKSGNRTKGPRLIGNEGNESPAWMRSLPRTSTDVTAEDRAKGRPTAEAVKSQYNAEATYSPWANTEATNHLGELRTHLSALATAHPHPELQGLASRAARAHEAAIAKGGSAAHPDILGTPAKPAGTVFSIHPQTGQVVTSQSEETGRTRGHIDRISSALKSVSEEPGGIPAKAQPHFEAAMKSIAGYQRSFTPVQDTPFKEFKSDPSRVSLETNKAYYPDNVPADLTRTPNESKGNTIVSTNKETGELTRRVSEGKKTTNTPEARAVYSRIAETKKAEKKKQQQEDEGEEE